MKTGSGFGGVWRRWRESLAAMLRRERPDERVEVEPRIVPLRSRPQLGGQPPRRRDARMLQLYLEQLYGQPADTAPAVEPERQANRA